MKTVKLLSALVMCFCAFSASAATGSSSQITSSPLQYASFNAGNHIGGIALVRFSHARRHHNSRRMHVGYGRSHHNWR